MLEDRGQLFSTEESPNPPLSLVGPVFSTLQTLASRLGPRSQAIGTTPPLVPHTRHETARTSTHRTKHGRPNSNSVLKIQSTPSKNPRSTSWSTNTSITFAMILLLFAYCSTSSYELLECIKFPEESYSFHSS